MTIPTVPTHIPGLDAVLQGGFPLYSLNILTGHPGSGKTILAQQIAFNAVRHDESLTALYLSTLSEPTLKVLRYLQQFAFFDEKLFDRRVRYRDIGEEVKRLNPLELAEYISEMAIRYSPAILFIDSFKAIRDMTPDPKQFRRFCNELAVQLAAAQCTSFLIGEYDRSELPYGAEFAVADGIFDLFVREEEGEQKRFFQVLKCRGLDASLQPVPFLITREGVRVLTPALPKTTEQPSVLKSTGIEKLDYLLGGGLATRRTYMITGASGTGKTTLGLQIIYAGLKNGEKATIFSVEENPAELAAKAQQFNMDLSPYLESAQLEIFHIPSPEIRVDENLEMIQNHILTSRPQRVFFDSLSTFLNRIRHPATLRTKTERLIRVSRHIDGFILVTTSSEPYSLDPTRSVVEEALMDGIILLTCELERNFRRRYLEIFKLTHHRHATRRTRFLINRDTGIDLLVVPPAAYVTNGYRKIDFHPLHGIIPEEIRYGATWLVRGAQGIGKSTLAMQFAIEGLQKGESVLYVSLDAPAYILSHNFETFGISLPHERLTLLDSLPQQDDQTLDLEDPDLFFYNLKEKLSRLPKPCRIIVDSLTPIAIHYHDNQFAAFIEIKNRLLREPDVAVFDTILPQTLDENLLYTILNNYDVVIDLYTPDWGEMGHARAGNRVLQVRKVRGNAFDNRPYPYAIIPGRGIILNHAFYETIGESNE